VQLSGPPVDYWQVLAVQCRPVAHVVPQHGLPRPPHAMQWDDIPLPTHASVASAHTSAEPGLAMQVSPGWPGVPRPMFMQYSSEPL
jgi:hypothetical protein